MAQVHVSVADEVWIAACLLHQTHPNRPDFSIAELVAVADSAGVTQAPKLRPSIRVFASRHCVANKPPSTCKFRYLFATSRGRRRLNKPGDPYTIERTEGPLHPKRNEIPASYQHFIDWYWNDYVGEASPPSDQGLMELVSLRLLGEANWLSESADKYVNNLRSSWK